MAQIPVNIEELKASPKIAKSYFLLRRWPHYQRFCPSCGSRAFSRAREGKRRLCNVCHYEYSDFTGTWLERNRLEFSVWVKIIDEGFIRSQTKELKQDAGIRAATLNRCLNIVRLAIMEASPTSFSLQEIETFKTGSPADQRRYWAFKGWLASYHGVRRDNWPRYFHELEYKKHFAKTRIIAEEGGKLTLNQIDSTLNKELSINPSRFEEQYGMSKGKWLGVLIDRYQEAMLEEIVGLLVRVKKK